MELSKDKRETLQALSEYVGLLLELSDNCTIRRSIINSKWDYTDKNNPAEKLRDGFIEQLRLLPSQTARSQILMLSGSSLTVMYVYYMNMYVQLLLQRDVFARQSKSLYQLQDDCELITNCLRKFCTKVRDGELPEEMKEAMDIEQLESIIIKTSKRLNRVQNVLSWIDRKLRIYVDIDLILDRLCEITDCPKKRFGLIYIPYNFREEVKIAEPLARALSLHSKHARDRIDPDWEYPGYEKGWDLALADECQEFQNDIKDIDRLITECSDIPDMVALVKLVTKML